MEKIEALVDSLTSSDEKTAYANFKLLRELSEQSNDVYAYFDKFPPMLEHANSFVRTRALVLLSDNAKWDDTHKLAAIIDDYLTHITDEKPITARKCVQALPTIAKYQPSLRPKIVTALKKAVLSSYADTMRPLIEKDIERALGDIEKMH